MVILPDRALLSLPEQIASRACLPPKLNGT
jgi:hypothetical protein